jgi:RimJ/RimL family protein N-acetyltransferase
MTFTLETQRLILRSLQDADAEPFAKYRSDPEVARYQGWDIPFTLTQATQFIETMKQTQPGTPGAWFQIALQLKTSGQLIGDCAFCVIVDEPQQANIGFTLARHYQGNGYATEAVTRLLDYLFGALNLHRVRAICDVENLASARVLQRLGMRQEAHWIDNVWFKGRWSSEYGYAILEREWTQKTRKTLS